MINRITSVFAVTIIFLFMGFMVQAQNSQVSESEIIIFELDHYDNGYLLAHHAGNRPDDAKDIEERVHGGDGDYDDDFDPNGDSPSGDGGVDNGSTDNPMGDNGSDNRPD